MATLRNCAPAFCIVLALTLLPLSCAARWKQITELSVASSARIETVTLGSDPSKEAFQAFVEGLPLSRLDTKNNKFCSQSHPAFGEFGDFALGDPMFFSPDNRKRCIGDPKSYVCTGKDCACDLGASPLSVPIKFWAYRFAQQDNFTRYGLSNSNLGDLRWATRIFGELCEDHTITDINVEDKREQIHLAIFEVTVTSGFGVEAESYGACNNGHCSPGDSKYDDPSRKDDFVKLGWTRFMFDQNNLEGCLWFSFRAETEEQRAGWSAHQLLNARMTDVCSGARHALGQDDLYTVPEANVADYLLFLVAPK